jgi:hypothetical protein
MLIIDILHLAKPGAFAALIPKVSIGSTSLIPFHAVDTHEIFVYKRGFVVGNNISKLG